MLHALADISGGPVSCSGFSARATGSGDHTDENSKPTGGADGCAYLYQLCLWTLRRHQRPGLSHQPQYRRLPLPHPQNATRKQRALLSPGEWRIRWHHTQIMFAVIDADHSAQRHAVQGIKHDQYEGHRQRRPKTGRPHPLHGRPG